MKKIIIIAMLIVLTVALNGEISNKFLNSGLYQPSFFDLNKIDMNHSLSFQSGASSNGQGYYLSMYTNHLSFDFHPKLTFNLDLHFANFGTASFNKNFDIEGNNDNASEIFPEIQMEYKPNDNMSIRVEFGRTPGYYYRSSLFDNRWDD